MCLSSALKHKAKKWNLTLSQKKKKIKLVPLIEWSLTHRERAVFDAQFINETIIAPLVDSQPNFSTV